MSMEITTAFVKQFEDNVTMLAQQRGSRLRGLLRETNLTGVSVFMDQIGPTQALRTNSRHADSPLVNTPHARRRIGAINVEWGDLIDDFDKLSMIINPESEYAQNAAWAIGREIDDIIFEKFFADAYVGQEGNQTVSFPSSQSIDGTINEGEISGATSSDSTVSGLNVDKLQYARELLQSNEVDLDMETPVIAVPAKALTRDLLSIERATSQDFASVRALAQGQIDTFMGIRFVQSERVPTDSNGNFLCPMWVPSGMGLAVRKNPTARITERSDKRFSTYVYYSTSVGASRLEEEKVVQVPVHPTNGASTS